MKQEETPSPAPMKILIVEDDRVIAETLAEQLSAWGFETACAEDFRSVLDFFLRFDPQLVLLDLSLPFHNGYYWCTEIRKTSQVPVVFLSSASDSLNIVMAMNMGGDDFIPKPFDMNVLLAKLQAILRRAYNFRLFPAVLQYKGLTLDTAEASLTVNGQKLELTKNEYRILLTLMERQGTVVSRNALMERLWETDSFIDDNTLTVNVNRLRKRLEAAGARDVIATRKGLGYVME